MLRYAGTLTILLLPAMVLTRSALLRWHGIIAIKFGAINKTDFLIPPFALFYIYLVAAAAFGWPTVARGLLIASPLLAWIGAALCAAAIVLMFFTLISFGASFRVGIDTNHPDRLVTSGVFALTRNPIYVAFGFALVGELLILPNWLMLLYLLAGFALFHRQVLLEEAYLAAHYGEEYAAYSKRVRRYL